MNPLALIVTQSAKVFYKSEEYNFNSNIMSPSLSQFTLILILVTKFHFFVVHCEFYIILYSIFNKAPSFLTYLSKSLSCQCPDAIEENLVETVDDFEEEIVVVAVGIAFAVVYVVEIAVVVEKAFAVASTVAADVDAAAVVAQKAVAVVVVLETELAVLD